MPLSPSKPQICLAAAIAILTLAGCAAAPSHYGTTALTRGASNMGAETFRGKRSPLSESETSANCTGLKTAMQTHAAEIKAARARMAEELKSPAPSLDRMSRRASGEEGGGTVAYDQIKNERYIMTALNARLSDRGCPTLDVEQSIAAAAGAPATTASAPAKTCAATTKAAPNCT
jgi:hypothetical protein